MAEETGKATFSAKVIARLLDMTEARVHQLAKEGVIPKEGRGEFPLAGAVRGYINFLRQTGASSEIDPEKLDPFKRRAHYQAEAEKLVLQQKRGELVPRIEMEAEQGRVAKIVTECLETLPDKLERDAGLTAKQAAIVEKACNVVREQMYQLQIEDGDVRASA